MCLGCFRLRHTGADITIYEVRDMNQSSSKSKRKVSEVKRRTVGQEALDLFQKGAQELSVVALQQEMTREYYQNLIDCALKDRKLYSGRFFIVVITKNERLLPNVFRDRKSVV